MRRLDFQGKRDIKSTVFIFLGILVVLIYFIFTVGFKIILNGSVYIANLFSKDSTTPLTKSEDIYGLINIDNIPVATNSARIVVSGSVLNFSNLKFYINGEKVEETDLISSDSFTQEIGDLEKGSNEVFIKASTNDGKNSKKTTIYKVTFIDEKPLLEISDPQDKSTTSKSEIQINGKTNKEIFVKVNDLPIVVDANGNFHTSVRLKEGENSIVVIAADIAGNTEEKTLAVTYQKEE